MNFFFFCNWTSLFELKKKIAKFQASAYSIINNIVGLLEKTVEHFNKDICGL